MIIVTTETVPGKAIAEVKGLVRGITVQEKQTGTFGSLLGGEMDSYNEMLDAAVKIAIGRMVEDAKRQGANAIIGMQLMSSTIVHGAAEMVAYGTAVVVK
ncbi:MAG: hypothetical protein ATN35_06930 [Epulopiscium sp. Nele67-Bin004]|nr:MAG: hypothetical protein ATN35_06930 [Epulopiscium sp. Nele67-Bin004]